MSFIELAVPYLNLALSESFGIINILIIIFIFFGVLLLIVLRKSYLLNKENERLEALNDKMNKELDQDNKPYEDFTDGHMYGEK
ncbi:hypothetical protein F6U93_04045 [Tamlana haliotis]|uniref:Uncharacterized protein n=1 Tax=Pseudotamlana haliotis TaxID=2614804 RepID=A0A6N6MIE4_9FLAO|nr:hypothetical protein [Tamlana haliotis]KAB1069316.1 hypothetical protein F6U93_04045 [Tamlana haliotis]